MGCEVLDDLLLLQELDHQELILMTKESDIEWTPTLTKLVDRVITHYENYYRVESNLIMQNVQLLLLLSHVWPSHLEDDFLWVGGWRPSMYFHLLDFNPKLQLGVELGDLLKGAGMRQFKNILPSQLVRVDELQRLTIQAEIDLTQSLATDSGSPILELDNNNNENNNNDNDNMHPSNNQLGDIFSKADNLRLTTLKNLVQILSPIQAVQLFIPAAQLHLKVHTWGKNKQGDHHHHLQHSGSSGTVSGIGSSGGGGFNEVFELWLVEQQQDLEDLKSAAKSYTESTHPISESTQILQVVVSRVMSHYGNYYRVKSESAKESVLGMLTPSWRSLLEHAFLWIGGWRPSTAFHLLYSVVGLHLDASLSDLLEGSLRFDDLKGLSSTQLTRVDELQLITVKEERELTETLASFQETMADSAMVQLSRLESKARDRVRTRTQSMDEQISLTLCRKEEMLHKILTKADDLRMKTLKKVVEMLTPIQAVDFLIAAAELNLSVHEWGKNKDAVQQH